MPRSGKLNYSVEFRRLRGIPRLLLRSVTVPPFHRLSDLHQPERLRSLANEHELTGEDVIRRKRLAIHAESPSIEIHAALLEHAPHIALARKQRVGTDERRLENVVRRELVF